MSAAEVQSLLRFLTQEAKVPLSVAISKVRELQAAKLGTPEDIIKKKASDLVPIFSDDKISKQVLTAAKRVAKKRRAAGDDDGATSPKRKRAKNESLFTDETDSSLNLEESLVLPNCDDTEKELATTVIFSNRAPLVLAFVVTLLKYTMPEQPLSSRLSLAQAYVSTTSRARAVNLGIESGLSAEEEGFGEGQPFVTIMGKKLHVLRRWNYEWQAPAPQTDQSSPPAQAKKGEKAAEEKEPEERRDEPALWALDLEALKKSNTINSKVSNDSHTNNSSMPIYTAQSARAYLLKSFDSPPRTSDSAEKKLSAAAKTAEKGRNLGMLLRCLDSVYRSWSETLDAQGLDNRTWGWYVRVRPSVEDGVAGWGGKNQIKLADILALRR